MLQKCKSVNICFSIFKQKYKNIKNFLIKILSHEDTPITTSIHKNRRCRIKK